MKFSENWLREWIHLSGNAKEWSNKLTAAGLEVEAITPLGANLENICVGFISSVQPHPNADRLRICEVLVNNDSSLTIVCGAPNAREGLKVIVAQIGAVLPNSMKIQRSKIRGIESHGMLCSSSELGFSELSAGIMELPEDAPVGMSISEYFALPDHILDISITPNRGDCLSVAGLSRELAAISGWPLTFFSRKDISSTIQDSLPVQLTASQDCPRYVGRIIQNIQPNAHTPLWMQEKLKRSNMRCIHPVVDSMNYVMLELGQPLHAFDLAAIKHEVQIRKGKIGETATLLDGQTVTVDEDVLVIADKEKILALAGIMGSAESAVSATTTAVFIESAFFSPKTIATTLRKLRLQSDAAYRFERGVDPELALRAMHRASELVLSICGGQAGPVIEQIEAKHLPMSNEILLRAERVKRLLGIDIPHDQIKNLLHRLNLQTQSDPQGWIVSIPSYRFDINLEIDLIEEIARLYGYVNIPSQPMQAPLVMQKMAETQLTQKRIRDYWADRGYCEAIHYSFTEPKLADLLDPQEKLRLRNPISADLSVMRTTLWAGLIQSAIFNLNRQLTHVKLFELGTCFFIEGQQTREAQKLAGIAVGQNAVPQWALPERDIDFFDIKGDLGNLFALTKSENFDFTPAVHPALHPSRCAQISRAGKLFGWLGELHPTLRQTLDIAPPVYLFELNLDDLSPIQLPACTAVSKYPWVKRDLAFIIQDTIAYHSIYKAVCQYAGEILKNVALFDLYKGSEIAEHQMSMALSFTFQLNSRTLTDEEVEKSMQTIIAGLIKDFQIVVRDKKIVL